MQRAKQGLNIRNHRIVSKGEFISYWLLPGQVLPAGASDFPEMDRAQEELETLFSPPNPLDEE